MKIWNSYGSEHSANLVMIGHFKEADDAQNAKEVIGKIEDYISETGEDHHNATRFSEGMLELLSSLNFHTVQPSELEQFSYRHTLKLKDKSIVVTTDEMDISAYLKVLVNHGAKVEVYSAHDYESKDEAF